MKNKVLIVGKLPPPIGGVTIHVKRLYKKLLKLDKVNPNIFNEDISIKNFRKLFSADVIHIHLNNSFKRFLFVIIALLFKKKSIITFHRDIDRNKGLRRKIDELAIRYVNLPLMLNKNSYEKAEKLNANAKLISSFLAPEVEEPLPKNIQKIVNTANKYDKVFATNAHHYREDKNAEEIYGILELIEVFKNLTSISLVVSDPSGEYKERIEKRGLKIPPNIFLISSSHSFFSILKNVDGFIRNTTTDGDSLSIREALYLNKIVLSTDIVNRPRGTHVYELHNTEKLKQYLLNPCNLKTNNNTECNFNIYLKYLNSVHEL